MERRMVVRAVAVTLALALVAGCGDSGGPKVDTVAVSGTVYLDDRCGGARAVCERWATLCEENPGVYDQALLHRAVEGMAVSVAELPAEYCFLFDTYRKDFYRRNHPETGEPVIEHLQASRVFRER